MPKVVIEEFVPDETQEEDKDQAGTPHKVITHHEVDDVSIFRSNLTPYALVRQAGLEGRDAYWASRGVTPGREREGAEQDRGSELK